MFLFMALFVSQNVSISGLFSRPECFYFLHFLSAKMFLFLAFFGRPAAVHKKGLLLEKCAKMCLFLAFFQRQNVSISGIFSEPKCFYFLHLFSAKMFLFLAFILSQNVSISCIFPEPKCFYFWRFF